MSRRGVLAWSSREDACCRHEAATGSTWPAETCQVTKICTVLACIASLALRLRRCFLLPSIGKEDSCRFSWTSFRRSAMPLTSPDPPPGVPAHKVCCWSCNQALFAESVMATAGSMSVLLSSCTRQRSPVDASRQTPYRHRLTSLMGSGCLRPWEQSLPGSHSLVGPMTLSPVACFQALETSCGRAQSARTHPAWASRL